MFCPECGTQIEEGGRFCPNCGTFVPAQGEADGTGGQPGGEAGRWNAAPGPGPGNGGQWNAGPGTGTENGPRWNGGQNAGPGAAGGGAGFTGGGNGTPGPGRPRKGLLIGIIAALAVLCIGAAVLLFLRGRGEEETTASGGTGNGTQSTAPAIDSGQSGGAGSSAGSGLPAAGGETAGNPSGNSAGNPAGTGETAPGAGMTNEQAGQVLSGAAENQNSAQQGVSMTGAPQIREEDITISMSDLAKQITELNAGTTAQQKIDIFANNYTPVRNTSLAWDRTLFYTLEDVRPDSSADGQINSYLVSKKTFVNAATGNRMEYEIYTKPGTGTVNKIVSIEYMQDHLEITDYYYRDDGKVSFIFLRNDLNYVPSYAVPTKDGQRFYFNSDCMVKWRVVSGGNIQNYCIGSASMSENNNGSEKTYDSLDATSQGLYDEAEKNMLNAAYNTYNTVLGAASVNWITGFVYSADETARKDAHIYLWRNDEYLYMCSPADDGSYYIAVPGNEDSYRLVIVTPGCDTVIVYDIEIVVGVLYTYVDTIYVMDQSAAAYQQVLQVRDALNYAENGVDMMAVPDAQINIRCGLNAKTTDVVYSGTTDSLGNCNVQLPPGMYTVEVIKTGYDVIYVNIVIRVDMGTVEIHFSPSLPAGEMRIVLSWGQWPYDLDSHLFTPYDSAYGNEGYHVFYSSPTDAVGDNLDVDDTTSYGPETITIPVVKDGLYKYYVVDYSNCSQSNPTSFDMSNSGAVVNVYSSAGLIATFHVPTGQSGVIWEVFEIRNGQIIPNQRYYNNIDATDWWYR